MKFKFWSFLFISVFFPLLVICAWGMYFIQSYENQNQERHIRERFKQEQFFYFKSLDVKSLFLEKKIQQALKKRRVGAKSPLSALMILDDKGRVKKYFWRDKDSSFKKKIISNRKKITSFIKDVERSSSKNSFYFDVFSFNKKDKINMVILEGGHFSFLKNKKQIIIGFLRDNNFFQINPISNEELPKIQKMFLVNSKGRLLFHNDSQHLFKILPKKSSVRKSIQDFYYGLDKRKWFLKNPKGKNKMEIAYVQKWKGKDAFLVTKESVSSPLLVFNSWFLKWSLFCLGIFLLIFMGLIFTVSPLFSAYNYLKSFFIYFARTGEVPSWSQDIKNPFLYFYNNRNEQFRYFRQDKEISETDSKTQTFQSLLQAEVKKIKFKYPGLRVIEKFESNVKLFEFENFMRTILHELLLNAVESMGSYETQDIIISSKEDGKWFIFSIKDGGVGLLEEERNKVFQLYYSTKSQLGVGLNLVHSLVTSNNGKVEFLSSPQKKGLEVVITLPMSCFLKVKATKKTVRKEKYFNSFKRGKTVGKSSKVSL